MVAGDKSTGGGSGGTLVASLPNVSAHGPQTETTQATTATQPASAAEPRMAAGRGEKRVKTFNPIFIHNLPKNKNASSLLKFGGRTVV